MPSRQFQPFLVLVLLAGVAFGQETQAEQDATEDQQQGAVELLEQENHRLRMEIKQLKAELLLIRKKLAALDPEPEVQAKETSNTEVFNSLEQILKLAPPNTMPPPQVSWNEIYRKRFNSWLKNNVVGKILDYVPVVAMPRYDNGKGPVHVFSSVGERGYDPFTGKFVPHLEVDSFDINLVRLVAAGPEIVYGIRHKTIYESKEYGTHIHALFSMDSPTGQRVLAFKPLKNIWRRDTDADEFYVSGKIIHASLVRLKNEDETVLLRLVNCTIRSD